VLSQPDADDAHLALAVNPRDGTVWLGLHQTLFHFDAQGPLLKTIPLTDNVQALALDIALARLWVATQRAVSAYADTGHMVVVLALGKSPEVRAIDVDAASGELWLALKQTLQRYHTDGALRFQISLDKLAHVASDGQGNVWVATDKDLIRVDQFGQAKFMPRPFSGTDTIVALTSDPADSSAWVASHNALSHIDAEGFIIRQLAFNGSDPDLHFEGSIRAVAVYADTIPPTLSFAAPVGGSLINTNPPDIAVEYRDVGVGVNTATLHIQANADALAVDCTFGETGATCRPAAKLPGVPVTLIADHAGNLSEPAEISFTMDTIPPIITRMSRMRAPRPITPSRSSAGI
jgi:hypothetical protein